MSDVWSLSPGAPPEASTYTHELQKGLAIWSGIQLLRSETNQIVGVARAVFFPFLFALLSPYNGYYRPWRF